MDTASSFLYDINTVLIFSLIYSILFSTNIVERTEKKRRRHQCYYLFIIMLLLIVVHWHCSKHSWSARTPIPKRTFPYVPIHPDAPRKFIQTFLKGIWLSLRVSNDVQKVIALFSVGLILIWFLESSKIPLEVNCQVNWGQTIYKLLIMAGHRVQEHLRGLNLCY